MDEGTFAEGLPLQGMMEDIVQRPMRLVAEIDNETAILAVRRGFSRRLADLKKGRHIQLSALHEIHYGEEGNEGIKASWEPKAFDPFMYVEQITYSRQ